MRRDRGGSRRGLRSAAAGGRGGRGWCRTTERTFAQREAVRTSSGPLSSLEKLTLGSDESSPAPRLELEPLPLVAGRRSCLASEERDKVLLTDARAQPSSASQALTISTVLGRVRPLSRVLVPSRLLTPGHQATAGLSGSGRGREERWITATLSSADKSPKRIFKSIFKIFSGDENVQKQKCSDSTRV